MHSHIVVYGISHKTADLSTRERLALPLEAMSTVLFNLRGALTEIKEVMMLSTCQRTECYFYMASPTFDMSRLTNLSVFPFSAWKSHAYFFQGEEALIYMMRVANGLDSSLLGEPQILGQMRAAYQAAKAMGSLGKHLEQILQCIFGTAKKVRSHTDIGRGALSLPYTAVNLGKCIFSEISNPYVVLIGAGSMIQTVLTHLVKKNRLTVVIANRSFAKAEQLAQKYGATAITLEKVYQHVALADVVISATKSTSFILSYAKVEQALSKRVQQQPLFVVDMAVPRDIAPEIATLPSVFLYNIDDLHKVVQRHLEARQQAASEAEDIIKAQVQGLIQKMELSRLGLMVYTFRNQMSLFRKQLLEAGCIRLRQNACAKAVIGEVLGSLEQWALSDFGILPHETRVLREGAFTKALRLLRLNKAPDQVLCDITHTFVNQLLHKPTVTLKAHSQAVV